MSSVERREIPQIPEIIDQLKKLWVLDLVVSSASFQEAASRAKITRSAVSQTISQLERFFGHVLLIRSRGDLKPTPECEALLRKARPLFKSLRELHKAEPSETPPMKWLDIGAFESISVEIVPPLMQSLQEKIPNLKLKVRVARSHSLATMVRKGELCMALVTGIDIGSGLTAIPVGHDRLGVFLSKKLVEAKGKEAAQTLPLGAFSLGAEGQPTYYMRFSKALKWTKQPAFSSDSYEALLSAVCYGSVMAILPTRVARRRLAELTEITPKELIEKRIGHHEIYLISRQNCDPRENEFLAKEIHALLES